MKHKKLHLVGQGKLVRSQFTRKKLSKAARHRISVAQKARWAKRGHRQHSRQSDPVAALLKEASRHTKAAATLRKVAKILRQLHKVS
jgi:hypothetical protein